MKIKEKINTIIICAIILCLYTLYTSYNKINNVDKVYNIYLEGEVIGAISGSYNVLNNGSIVEEKDNNILDSNKTITGRDALYNLIDKKQQSIKDKFEVDKVYPPDSLQIVENYSYDTKVSSLDSIYNKIEELKDFTIKGYEVTFTNNDTNKKFSIYVLDKKILKDALENFILAFIDEEGYYNYLNGNNKELDDIGITYEKMQIVEDISIREKYISVNDKIYTDSDSLAQELLFGFNYKEQRYTVKAGDTIESISEKNTLNTQEFLIANPKYSSKDSLLAIDDTVNITLINPVISFSYQVNEVKKIEIDYDEEIKRDNTKSSDFEEITQPGVSGISIVTSYYEVVNGEQSSENIDDSKTIVIRPKVDQITTKGKQQSSVIWGNETWADTGSGWRWPTDNPYAVTSEFAPRWGKIHGGIDISGTGIGSRIYAANDGIVSYVFTGCNNSGFYGSTCGSGFGNHVVIKHDNNIYTLYGHMLNNIPVKVGQTVRRGTIVGYMGDSGSSKGYHLHFSAVHGDPKAGGSYFNPRELYPKR